MEETNYYKAKDGYTFRRKIDGYIMGNELQDAIDNYEEVVDETLQTEETFNGLKEE